MHEKEMAKKILKRVLKKKAAYSSALLINFLITGGISFAANTWEGIQKEKDQLSKRMVSQRELVSEKISETKEEKTKKDEELEKLLFEADFYGKPLMKRYQLFFPIDYKTRGEKKDNTKGEFKETFKALKNYKANHSDNINDSSLWDMIYKGNGIVTDSMTYSDVVDIGANVKSKDIILPDINPEVDVSIELEEISLGDVPEAPNISIPSITPPVISSKNLPVISPIAGVTIAAPSSREKIEVAEVDITAPVELELGEVAVQAPVTPAGFEPKQVIPPEAPEAPVIIPPTLPDFNMRAVSSGNAPKINVINTSLSNGYIEMVAITGGEFRISRPGDNKWHFEFDNYTGINAFPYSSFAAVVNGVSGLANTSIGLNRMWNYSANLQTGTEQLGFQKLVGANSGSTMLSNANFLYTNTKNSNTLNEFVHLDIHNAVLTSTARSRLVTATSGLANRTKILDSFDDATENADNHGTGTSGTRAYTWINSGKIVIEGGNASVTNHYDHHGRADARSLVLNTGEIKITPFKDGTFIKDLGNAAFVMSLDGNIVPHIMYNSGKIDVYTKSSAVFYSGSSSSNRPLSVINRGEIGVYGEGSVGIYIKTSSNNDYQFVSKDFDLSTGAGQYNPITIYGDKSMGLFIETTTNSGNKGHFAVDIGAPGEGNKTFSTLTHNGENYTAGDKLSNYDLNPSDSGNENIEGSYGILSKSDIVLDSHQIRIFDKNEKSIGVAPLGGKTLNLGAGKIELKGGLGNIGMFISGSGGSAGKIISSGEVAMEGGKSNMAIYISGSGNSIKVNKITGESLVNSNSLFAKDGGKITVDEGIDINGTVVAEAGVTNSAVGAFAQGSGSEITINKGSLGTSANISITGTGDLSSSDYVGLGLMAKDGGKINAKKNYLELIDTPAGIASIGSNSFIDLAEGHLKYTGKGYAAYSDGSGKVDLSGALVELGGSATAFDLDLNTASPITLDSSSRINVKSDDVVVFNLKNATGLDTNNLEASIVNAVGSGLGGVNLNNLVTSDSGIDDYKIAAADGGTIMIGDLDKTGTGAPGETPEQEAGDFYYNRFLGQRLVATTHGGSIVSAVLNNAQAARYNNQVVGLEMNSSRLASSNTEAGIHLVSSEIIADRTELGSGAIGAFINYGLVSLDENSKITIEGGNNVVNKSGVGIYAVNGSEVGSDGEVHVSGEDGVGILGYTYRLDDSGNPIVDEFGTTASGQGRIAITNTGSITLTGNNTVGIYAENNNINSGTPILSNSKIVNAGSIKVGDSTGSKSAIGIYGNSSVIEGELTAGGTTLSGEITVGDGGIGIYGENGSKVDKMSGSIVVGKSGKGIFLKDSSTINSGFVVKSTGGLTDPGSSIGLVYDDADTSADKTLKILGDVDTKELRNGVSLYSQDGIIELANSGNKIVVGEDGVGMAAKGIDSAKVINHGTIKLKETSGDTGVGLYTDGGTIENHGVIKLEVDSQIAMVGSDNASTNDGSVIKNEGNIKLVDDSIGIHIKGSNSVLDSIGTIDFTSSSGYVSSGIGVYSEEATVKISDNRTIESNNDKGNILVYGKEGSLVEIATGKTLTVKGDGSADSTSNKTVGVYLENAGVTNTFKGDISVLEDAIGIYSKGQNIFEAINISAIGSATTGIYMEGGGVLQGTASNNVVSRDGAIGIYGDGGAIQLTSNLNLSLENQTMESVGMYLTNGASVSGNRINLNNTSPLNRGGIGLYYLGETGDDVTHGTDLIFSSDNLLGLYVAGGMTLNNSDDIEGLSKNNNVGVYVDANSKYVNGGDIKLLSGSDNIGIYSKNEAVNTGKVEVEGSNGVGMFSVGDSGNVTNMGVIDATIGMYIDGENISAADGAAGVNKGEIKVGASNSVGIYLNEGTFSGTATSKIVGDGIGIYLKEDGNVLSTGKLETGIGVYSEGGIVDFDIANEKEAAIALVAQGNTDISSSISGGKGSIAIYVKDNTVTFNGATIETDDNLTTPTAETSVGLYIDKAIGTASSPYNISNVNVKTTNGIGIYLENDTSASPITGSHLLVKDTVIETKTGVGVYVQEGTSFETGSNVEFNIDGGTGIYLSQGGKATLGTGTSDVTFNFGSSNGIAIFSEGGSLNLGSGITANGNGTLIASHNSDLNIDTDINVENGSIGILSAYDSNVTSGTTKSLIYDGNLNVSSGSMGLAAIFNTTQPLGDINILNKGVLTVGGPGSIGIYTNLNNATVTNAGSIKVKDEGVGIYSDGSNSIDFGSIAFNGRDGIGVYAKNLSVLTGSQISSGGHGNIGIFLDHSVLASGSGNLGSIQMEDGGKGVYLLGGNATLTGNNVEVGDDGAIAVVASGASVDTTGIIKIKAGNDSIGVYGEKGSTLDLALGTISVGNSSIYAYSKDSTLNASGNLVVQNNQTGIRAEGGTVNFAIPQVYTISEGGVGLYTKGSTTLTTTSNLTLNLTGGSSSAYSIGSYHKGGGTLTDLTVNQNGNFSIGTGLDQTNLVVTSNVSLQNGHDNIRYFLKNGSEINGNSNNIMVSGEKNIGVFSEKGKVSNFTDLNVGSSNYSSDKSLSAIGVYQKDGEVSINNDVVTGDNSIGIYSEGGLVSVGGDLNIGDNALGVYGSGVQDINISSSGGILTVGDNDSIGVFANNKNMAVGSDITVGENSIALVGIGRGDIITTGNTAVIGDNSVGIYKKDGTGEIKINSSNWSVGELAYGVYVTQSGADQVSINNSGDISLGEASIGIYSDGNNIVNNSGLINTGATKFDTNNPGDIEKHQNSVGMYLTNGSVATNQNNGTIVADDRFSLAVYATGKGTKFTNNGKINVSNGGRGILVRNGAEAINNGLINLDSSSTYSSENVGMAAYNGSRITNFGTINVGSGVGMLVGVGGTLANKGTILVDNGTGISGRGNIVNSGSIIVTGNGVAQNTGSPTMEIGSVVIEPDGTVTINNNYISIGGTLTANNQVNVDGAYVDITTGIPLFNAPNVSGEVNILPNFAGTGNGISYSIDGFINTVGNQISGGKLTATTSPLFISKITDDGTLIIVKRPYNDLVIGDQFKELGDGLDDLLAKDPYGKDGEVLKNVNEYLEGLPDSEFERESARVISETRGDIYSTIQERMQNIEEAYDSSFDELRGSYNTARENGKFSVLYTNGDYNDGTVGITDYDYSVIGLLYMDETEGSTYGATQGYTLGFSVANFDFDDEGSEEDVYSLRAGIHKVTPFNNNDLSLLTRLGIGFNRHETTRAMRLDKKYENDTDFNSYSIKFENKLSKNLILNLSKKLDIYAGFNLEYGKFDDFKEEGVLELEVDGHDYFSQELVTGIAGHRRYYLGNNLSIKLGADANYSYELGENYGGNRARVSDSDKGYYDLITPEEREGVLSGEIEATLEKANHMGVTFAIKTKLDDSRDERLDTYSLRFNYKF